MPNACRQWRSCCRRDTKYYWSLRSTILLERCAWIVYEVHVWEVVRCASRSPPISNSQYKRFLFVVCCIGMVDQLSFCSEQPILNLKKITCWIGVE